jgi:hypothetical protein
MQRRTTDSDRVAQVYPQAPGSLSTTRRATVEVFQPASTRGVISKEGKLIKHYTMKTHGGVNV